MGKITLRIKKGDRELEISQTSFWGEMDFDGGWINEMIDFLFSEDDGRDE